MLANSLGYLFLAQPKKCINRIPNLIDFLGCYPPTTLDYHGNLLFNGSIFIPDDLFNTKPMLPLSKGLRVVYSYFEIK
jgi:hypothetical protein